LAYNFFKKPYFISLKKQFSQNFNLNLKSSAPQNTDTLRWFVDSYTEANNNYTSGNGIGIASAIYPVPEKFDKMARTSFPYHQTIRGNGACYLNSCLVGILNKCVNDEAKWQKFKDNVAKLFPSATNIINQIEARAKSVDSSALNNGLDRIKLNQMLQEKGNTNLGTQLAKEILIKEHQALTQIYDLKIAGEQTRFDRATKQKKNELASAHLINIEIYNIYKGYIEKAGNDFAKSYEEAMLVPYVNDLTRGMRNNGGSLTILTFKANTIKIPNFLGNRDQDTICLYNPGGHFDLLYSSADPICDELQIQIQQATTTRDNKQQKKQLEREKLVDDIYKISIINTDAVSSEIINQILQGKTIKDLRRSSSDFSIDNLKLLKSIYEASSQVAQQSKTNTRSEFEQKLTESKANSSKANVQTTPQNQPDPNTCYQLALDEIKNNPNPGELFEMYLEAIKKDSSKLTDENSVRNLSHFAAMTGKSSFIAPLIKHLPDSFSVKDHNEINADNNPLMWSIANAKNQFAFDLLTQTQAPKVDIDINNISEQYGTNALHWAVAKDYDDKDSQGNQVGIANHQLVKELIDCDADPNIQTTKSGLSALDIAVLRGSKTMVLAILGSKKINSSTILKAIEDIDEPKDDSGSGLCQWFTASQTSTQIQTPKEEATKKLQQICGGDLFKQLEDDDVSDNRKTNIKNLLEKKLQELDPFYQDKKNELIKKFISSSGESNFGTSIQFKDQDKNFLCFSKPSSEIVKFYPILHRDRDKFNYNKKLDNGATYDPEEFTKEKEQEKILDLLKQAKEITSKNFANDTLDDNFFIAVMKVASENRGIASITDKKTFNESYKKALDELSSTTPTTTNVSQGQDLHEIAKFFSAQFQELSREQNYLTGRDSINGEINQTPRRLFRVCTVENIEKFKENLFGIGAPSSSPSTPSTPKSIRGDATPDRI